MPTYEYVCKSCGEHLEVVQSFKDAALTDCPACGGSLRKVFQPIGIAFKGSGFYKNDSRAGSSKGSADKTSDTSTAASSSEGKASSTDTKSTTAAPSSDKTSGAAAS
ncbi:MAG: FmdB family transcriptional regulator [Actinobacteria bacterium]|nr:FmdB family transcriptional regulator [Actinomycetota bacterium]MBW3650629.1 FmdB family transcriptional regulator [Actinomycetota bacterium]